MFWTFNGLPALGKAWGGSRRWIPGLTVFSCACLCFVTMLLFLRLSVFNTPPSAFKWLVWLLNTFCVVGCVESGVSLHLVSLCFKRASSALDFHFCAQAFKVATGIQIASRASSLRVGGLNSGLCWAHECHQKLSWGVGSNSIG